MQIACKLHLAPGGSPALQVYRMETNSHPEQRSNPRANPQ
jgi:hypothetical protein